MKSGCRNNRGSALSELNEIVEFVRPVTPKGGGIEELLSTFSVQSLKVTGKVI